MQDVAMRLIHFYLATPLGSKFLSGAERLTVSRLDHLHQIWEGNRSTGWGAMRSTETKCGVTPSTSILFATVKSLL